MIHNSGKALGGSSAINGASPYLPRGSVPFQKSSMLKSLQAWLDRLDTRYITANTTPTGHFTDDAAGSGWGGRRQAESLWNEECASYRRVCDAVSGRWTFD
ncbi:hypothetical protein PAAG_08146 [Paracoccidioides lutzii Pb01]|uniref:Uncharacterized protein n=1 Tax=Paracoccidioides lutzii (strain ATCC MYA-826 / Pb01) TaxID=502779 RepID=C1HBK5_PARBA|nr:hypothetical protein PAAG_08146 [Paracoccidioides lutzii Pb01]EEH38419.2 hypothetical protein PAAG_08146 [Paracoccidioides lutzii Pb01]